MLEQIEKILDEKVRPMLRSHGGEVRLTGCEDGVVRVELLGQCSGCPSADLSTRQFIEDVLKENIPGIEQVELSHPIDPEMLNFALKILNHKA